jgi:hypothetical protein
MCLLEHLYLTFSTAITSANSIKLNDKYMFHVIVICLNKNDNTEPDGQSCTRNCVSGGGF